MSGKEGQFGRERLHGNANHLELCGKRSGQGREGSLEAGGCVGEWQEIREKDESVLSGGDGPFSVGSS